MQNHYLQAAIEAAKAAEQVINHYYKKQIDVELKQDRSPVTVADVESERAIKSVIQSAFPEHGFFGEETGKENAEAEYLWLIDPIDGTKSFVRQYPFFSTQIALMHQGHLIAGVSNAPVFGEMAYAATGEGAYLNGQPIKVSGVAALQDVTLSLGNIASLAQSDSWGKLGELIPQVNRIRGYGDFFHYHLLASGKIDLVIESDVNILDIAALAVIISEAGGVLTDLHQNSPGLETTTVLAAGNAGLHAQIAGHLAY